MLLGSPSNLDACDIGPTAHFQRHGARSNMAQACTDAAQFTPGTAELLLQFHPRHEFEALLWLVNNRLAAAACRSTVAQPLRCTWGLCTVLDLTGVK